MSACLAIGNGRRVLGLTEIHSDVAFSLKLLTWNLGTFGKQKCVPILVPHFGLGGGTLRQRGAMEGTVRARR